MESATAKWTTQRARQEAGASWHAWRQEAGGRKRNSISQRSRIRVLERLIKHTTDLTPSQWPNPSQRPRKGRGKWHGPKLERSWSNPTCSLLLLPPRMFFSSCDEMMKLTVWSWRLLKLTFTLTSSSFTILNIQVSLFWFISLIWVHSLNKNELNEPRSWGPRAWCPSTPTRF